ncbi:conserved hypothetical protein [Nocardia seriolae]|nr:conserved hypothetical protein [Nocardia seriolae]
MAVVSALLLIPGLIFRSAAWGSYINILAVCALISAVATTVGTTLCRRIGLSFKAIDTTLVAV